ncbi:MAG: D-alanyl-D-alanine carboxypeptidase family protein [Spirochaetia bacterium]
MIFRTYLVRTFFLAQMLFAAASAAFGFGPGGQGDVPIQALSAVMLELETGAVLYEKNPDIPIPPASLTKLMTVHLVLDAAAAGDFDSDGEIPIPEDAWWTSLPPKSSLMFLGPGQKLTLDELILGLTVSSGNDAAIAAAYLISGGVEPFVERMNREAEALGLADTRFADPSGLSADNITTARDFARFCRLYVELHPEALETYHAVGEFTYPEDHNVDMPDKLHRITQANRNALLGNYPGLDGLKSGYIDESGYNLAVTAEREGMRLIAVLLGGDGDTHPEGRRRVAADGRALLDYGYTRYTLIRPSRLRLEPVRVWKGRFDYVTPVPGEEIVAVIPKSRLPLIGTRIEYETPLIAPVFIREPIGRIVLLAGREELARFPLVAEREVEEAGFLKRWIHALRMLLE